MVTLFDISFKHWLPEKIFLDEKQLPKYEKGPRHNHNHLDKHIPDDIFSHLEDYPEGAQ